MADMMFFSSTNSALCLVRSDRISKKQEEGKDARLGFASSGGRDVGFVVGIVI